MGVADIRSSGMNAFNILVMAVVSAGGILAVTSATVCSLVRHDRERRDRQLFDAYIHRPRELETWLVRGALEHLQKSLVFEEPRR